ncbi:MAG: flagellar basal body-associated FliL family protein [Magnetococcales bacterium]|nr:flagellar basal body-associated FliL family protein [Magnetococcales bacterium]
MAEDAEQEGGGGGGGGMMKIILPVIALLLGVGGGYMAGSSMSQKQGAEAEKLEPTAEQKSKKPEEMVGGMFKLDPFVVNLNEPKGNRYLKTTIQLEMDDGGGKKGDGKEEKKAEGGGHGGAPAAPEKSPLEQELERRKAQLQDIILALLTSKTSKELQALEGKFRLREELLARINALLVNGSITRVYFTEFVIQ